MVGSTIFDLLGLFCGLYLAWIGWTALTAKPRSPGAALLTVDRPLARGLVFGLTNPKGYPVALATFTALLAGKADALSFETLPFLLGASFAGFLVGDALLIAFIGAGAIRRFYRAHELAIVRASGLLFCGFAIQAIWHAAPSLWRGGEASPPDMRFIGNKQS